MASGMLWSLAKWLIVIALCLFAINYWVEHKQYLFSAEIVHKIASKHAGLKDPAVAMERIHADFKKAYPDHILPKEGLEWMFMNAGGWMGAMCALHGTMTEYIIFFGSAMDTSGHSGRYWANISDTVITGTYERWDEGTLKTTTHKPGELIVHEQGEAAMCHFAADTWMLEYGRGFIPLTLPFPVATTLFNTLDFHTLFYVVRAYGKLLLQEAVYYIDHPHELF